MDANNKKQDYLMGETAIFKKLDRIDELLTLPTIAMEVNSMLQNMETSIKMLSDIIEKDQAIASKILRLVNSAFFGFPSKINNIPHALMVLGFNTVRNAVMSVSVIDTLSMKNVPNGWDIEEFWKHSLAVAVTSRTLAEKTKLGSPDNCFMGGLLHDIGKIILAQFFREIVLQILTLAGDEKISFSDTEKEINSIAHDQIGGYLVKQWKLPSDLVDAVRYHHSTTTKVYDLNFLIIIHTADYIVNAFNQKSRTNINITSLRKDAETIMEKQLETVDEWFPETAIEIDSACDFFLREI